MQEVTYYVPIKAGREKLTILNGLQGFFEPGKMTAVVSRTANRLGKLGAVATVAACGKHYKDHRWSSAVHTKASGACSDVTAGELENQLLLSQQGLHIPPC